MHLMFSCCPFLISSLSEVNYGKSSQFSSINRQRYSSDVTPFVEETSPKNESQIQSMSSVIKRITIDQNLISQLTWVVDHNLFGLRQCLHDINDKNMNEALHCLEHMPVEYHCLKDVCKTAYHFQNTFRCLDEHDKENMIYQLAIFISNSLESITHILTLKTINDDQKKTLHHLRHKLQRMSDKSYYSSVDKVLLCSDLPSYIKPWDPGASFTPIISMPSIHDLFWTLFNNMEQHSKLIKKEQTLYWFQYSNHSNLDEIHVCFYDKGCGFSETYFKQLCSMLKTIEPIKLTSSDRKQEGLSLSLQQLRAYNPVVFSRNKYGEFLSDDSVKHSFKFPTLLESGCGVRLTFRKMAYAIKHPHFPDTLQGETLNVLIIEDSLVAMRAISRKFEQQKNPSWNISFAMNKAELDKSLSGESFFHVYVVDSNIPGLQEDVLKICFDNKSVKSISSNGPIVISTTSSDDVSVSLKNAGTSGINVPIHGKNPNAILQCVTQVLSDRYTADGDLIKTS